MNIDSLCNKVSRLRKEISPIRTITAICEERSGTYLVDGKTLSRIDIDSLIEQGHKLVIRMIPEGLLAYI